MVARTLWERLVRVQIPAPRQKILQVSYIGITLAFQANERGSTPLTCSVYKKSYHKEQPMKRERLALLIKKRWSRGLPGKTTQSARAGEARIVRRLTKIAIKAEVNEGEISRLDKARRAKTK